MKRLLQFSFALLFSPFILSAQQVNTEYDYSGTASWISRTISNSSSNAEFVASESRIFREYKMEAVLSRGYGTSTSSMEVKEYYKHVDKIGRGSETITTEEGKASGSKSTDIILEFAEDGASYSFYIPIPACSGTKTKKISGGSTSTYEMGQEETMIQVESHATGSNRNVLSGEVKERSVGANGEIYESILTWSFVKGPLDAELIISPETYATWLPVPGKNETTAGNQINIGLKVQGRNGKELKLKAKSFELRLINTSREPGVTINFPLTTGEEKPDLRFTGAGASEDGQQLTLTPKDGKTGNAIISSYDGGAYTTLQAEAVLEGGIRVKGTLEVPTGVSDILIPKRKPGSLIAEAWLKSNGNPSEDADIEASKGNNNNGDGLTAYEEYRGVFSEGKFRRLDPQVKELGVQVKKETAGEFQGGLNLFSLASGVKVVKLDEDELGEDRQFNRNKGKAGSIQHALRLLDMRLDAGVVGRNEPEAESGKTPKQSQRTVIDLQQIKDFYKQQEAVMLAAKQKMPYTLADEIANTVAHELAHGVYITHHGPNSAVIPRTAKNNMRPPFALFDAQGKPITIPAEGIAMKLVGDKNGNESSGDLNCIIAYTTRYQWYFEQAPDRTLVYRAVPPLPQGKIFCTSGKGTGINANGYFGNSGKGNCLAQMRVKDK